MRCFIFFTTFACISFYGSLSGVEVPTIAAQSEEESLAIRRIVEFWRDQEYKLVKSQILDFLNVHPESTYTDSLRVILGDIYFSEKNYQEALNSYNLISTPSLQQQSAMNRLHCLYLLKEYAQLTEATQPLLPQDNSPIDNPQALILFYHAEGLFRGTLADSNQENILAKRALARSCYERLLETSYKGNAQLALAELNRLSGNAEEAAALYLSLADSEEVDREQMLFNAATMQAAYNQNLALETFSKVLLMDGEKAPSASFNWMLLMFETNHFQDLINAKDRLLLLVPEEKRPLVYFCVGRSYFSLNDYQNATTLLETFLTLSPSPSTQHKTALLTLTAASRQMKDLTKMDALISDFRKNFPGDPDLARALFLQALAYKDQEASQESLKLLEEIISQFPSSDQMMAVLFERNLLLFKQDRWQDSHDAFLVFVEQFPSGPYTGATLRYAVSACSLLVQETKNDAEASQHWRNQLLEDIDLALSSKCIQGASQRREYELQLAQTLYELHQPQEAIKVLASYFESLPDDKERYLAHFLLALCYLEPPQDLDAFIFHGEKVLAIQPDISEHGRLHLNLFSAYLEQAKKIDEKESLTPLLIQRKKELLDKAAEHLFAVLTNSSEDVQLENQLWLASHFYGKVSTHLDADWRRNLEDEICCQQAEKAAFVLQKSLGLSGKNSPLEISRSTLFLEIEAVKLANVFGWLHHYEAQIDLLEKLHKLQIVHSDWPWTLRTRTLLHLAKAYEASGRSEEALKVYQEITAFPKNSDPFAFCSAKLQLARLLLTLLPEEKRNESNEEMIAILKLFKDLQIRKTLSQEPIHLEAAIDYADIRASLEPSEKKDQRLLFLLNRVKEDFSLQDDVWSKDYSASRKLLPEKEIVYQAYIMLIDARIATLQARLARQKNALHEAENKEQVARTLYSSLLEGQFCISKYLADQAEAGMKEITPPLHNP